MRNDLTLRQATPEDAAALLSIYAPYVERTAVSFEWAVPTVAEFAERIRAVRAFYPYWVAEAGGEPVGYAYASPFKGRAAYAWSVETSLYVRMDQRRAGVGGVLHRALEDSLRAMGVLNMNACAALPEVEDETLTRDSVAFHERMGYRLVGEFRKCGYKFGRWYGIVWLEKLIGEHLSPQPEVVPFPTLRAD